MIDLTPLEVRKKKGDFRRGMRGYDPQAVDDFLDLVADRLEQLVRENASMTERLSRVEDQVGDYRERERALTEALVTAQEMREEMRKQIEREVELKRREAEADAESIRSEAAQVREREEESIRRLRARQSQFVQSYRAFLERELSELAVMTESLDLSRSAAAAAAPVRKPRKRTDAAKQDRISEPEPEAEPAAPPQMKYAEPEPMPLPIAIPEPTPMPEAEPLAEFDDWEMPRAAQEPAAPAPAAPPAAPSPAPIADPMDRSIDDMLNDLPAFAGTANVTQLEIAEEAPAAEAPASDDFVADPDEEAEVLADVRAEFDELVAEDLPVLPEAHADEDVLDLVDDVADDEDEDGWMSTLLEGKGDQGSK